jgi:UDP-N-acetylmuramoyl-tripeptide--D-alanyl-D-alanine ligase
MPISCDTLLHQAYEHRSKLTHVCFIGVTGSCGKTTTKDLIFRVLGGYARGRKSDGSLNCGSDLAQSLLAVREGDAFLVQEVGAWGPGTLDDSLRALRPDIGVVTNLRFDHYSGFHGPKGAQAEKGKLIACLPEHGTAVLNWDDPLARELAPRTAARVVSFGVNEDADVRAFDVSARWPERLTFSVAWDGQQRRVRTRLVGRHLLGSALAALAVGVTCGRSLEASVSSLESAEPTLRRMSAHEAAGVHFVRDEFKAPADSLSEVLAFMAEADAPRKIAVIGRLSDFPGRSRGTYTRVALEALRVLDAVIFVGSRPVELWGADGRVDLEALPSGARRGECFVFETVAHASTFLDAFLRTGDLVLLKGSGPTDHLERLLLQRDELISCWAADCGRVHACDTCVLLRRRPPAVGVDEARDRHGQLRPTYTALRDAWNVDPLTPPPAAIERLRNRPLGDDARILPVPWLINAAEYERVLRAGVRQRARALQHFFADVVLGSGRILEAPHESGGLTAEHLDAILASEGRCLATLRRQWQTRACDDIRFVYGPDFVRDAAGRWNVIEDNIGCIGGTADAFFVAEAYVSALKPGHVPTHVCASDLARALQQFTAAARRSSSPSHFLAQLACEPQACTAAAHLDENKRRERVLEALGIPASSSQSTASPGSLAGLINFDAESGPLAEGSERLFQRSDTPLLNTPGTGLLGNKCLLPFVDDMIRFYCEEEPVLRSPTTFAITDGDLPEDPTRWVIKSAAGSQGTDVHVLGDRPPAAVEQVRERIRNSWPERAAVAQMYVEPSYLSPGGTNAWDVYRLELRVFAYVVGWQHAYVGDQPLGKAVSNFDVFRLNNPSSGAAYVPVMCVSAQRSPQSPEV